LAVEIERYIVELGSEGRLIEMQLEETMVGAAAERRARRAYLSSYSDEVSRRRSRGRAGSPTRTG